jgi:hypothetical protein
MIHLSDGSHSGLVGGQGGAQQPDPQQVPPHPQMWPLHTVGEQAHAPPLQPDAQTCPQ